MTNKNYNVAKYTVEIEVTKSPNDVFNHLINLKKWWPEDFEGEYLKLTVSLYLAQGIHIIKKTRWLSLCGIKNWHRLPS